MQLTFDIKHQIDRSADFLLDKLPNYLGKSIRNFMLSNNIFIINEIRMTKESFISLHIKNERIVTDVFTSKELLNDVITSLCQGSVYAHLNTIKCGYINVGMGIRAGICGMAICDNNSSVEISGIYDISSIVIRLPQLIPFAGEFIFKLLKENNFLASLLLYSPPGVGKTTVLRDLVRRLSVDASSVRNSVIDTREEITPFLDINLTSNIYLSYPKGLGIEQATRNMTPQLIICDEITNKEDVQSILFSVNCGVALIATTHAENFEELCNKEILKPLFESKCFDYAVGLSRTKQNKFKYTVNKL